MHKYLFVVPPFFGHISPTLSVGASLLQRGHQVAWTGLIPLDDSHIPKGGEYILPTDELAMHQEEITRILRRQDDGPRLSGAETWKLALEETYIPFCRIMMNGLERVVDDYAPDVIISDCITFAGGLCAYKKQIPYVTSTPVPPDIGGQHIDALRVMEWQSKLMYDLQRSVGIDAPNLVIHSQKLNIVFTSSEFAAIENPEPHMRFVGPVKGRPNDVPFDWQRLENATGPKVFVSLGTLLEDIREAYFAKLVEAFANEPVTIIAATNPKIRDSWPANFIVQGFVPQAQLMPHMDVVICHGGFNTVNDAFANGLPMLITPIAYDHFHTAGLIEKAGCGIKIRYKRLRIADLRYALWQLIANDAYRQNAMRIGQSFTAAGGNERAVQLLEDFAIASPENGELVV
ncbi:glycosyltransferase [Parapedobacter tibetensis]|uniref:glycosyltransferase n=1 Tax=Parapedobacter tibetensis TaxID=2972951 RepID=UPI00214D39E7|nr:nucleotide disphospho-sugar-binding domain-containing protein [Parapedobacter tibetensis]